jgi:hypothetical protein
MLNADGNQTNGTIDYKSLPSADITLPAAGSGQQLVLTVTVNIDGDADKTMVYTVVFTKPLSTNSYSGTLTISGGSGYNLTSLSAMTSAGASADVNVDDESNWAVAIDKTKGDPVSFTASFLKAAEGKSYSVTIPAPTGSSVLAFSLNSSPGNPVYLMVQTAEDLANMKAEQNYLLMSDIDLNFTSLKKDWNGPTGYKGHFNGNGKTITLELSKDEGNTGLFNSLANGAIIENLNVAASTKNDTLIMTDSSHFGGVVGVIDAGGSVILRNIFVTGSLKYSLTNKGSKYLLAGGLIGEVAGNTKLVVENCKAYLDMNFTGNKVTAETNTLGFGSLIGKIGSNNDSASISITNSSTGGSIIGNLTNDSAQDLFAGGIVGCIGQAGEATKELLTISNCYSTTTIALNNNNTSTGKAVAAGGLIGRYRNGKDATVVKNSVALNPSVKAIGGTAPAANRIVGINTFTSNPNKGELLNNYALNTMIIGTTEPGAAVTSNDAPSISGSDKTDAEFKNAATWNDLGFNNDNWDFKNIATDSFPTLKLKALK